MGAFLGQVRLAQAAPTCEQTPEGGMRCSDGTYLPPGCKSGDPATVQGASPGGTPIWPFVVGAGALAAGAAIVLSGRRHLGATLEADYPTIAAGLRTIAERITGERAADAWNFSRLQEIVKGKYDLLFKQKGAEENMRVQERLWGQSHRNEEALQAATAEIDRLAAEIAQADAKAQEYRANVDANAGAIMRYRNQADALIESLPAEVQAEARSLIDPCFRGAPAMKGAFLGQVTISNRMPGHQKPKKTGSPDLRGTFSGPLFGQVPLGLG